MSRAANPFWEFAGTVYSKPGVEAECLALQNKADVDVMLLLFAAFCGANRIALTGEDIVDFVAETAPLRSLLVEPLRSARSTLKRYVASPEEEQRYASIRDSVRSAELTAERMAADRLLDLFAHRLASRPRSDCDLVSPNIDSLLLAAYGISSGARAACSDLVRAARSTKM